MPVSFAKTEATTATILYHYSPAAAAGAARATAAAAAATSAAAAWVSACGHQQGLWKVGCAIRAIPMGGSPPDGMTCLRLVDAKKGHGLMFHPLGNHGGLETPGTGVSPWSSVTPKIQEGLVASSVGIASLLNGLMR